jgi:hypothetical protein
VACSRLKRFRNDEPLIYETLITGGGYDKTGMRYATEKQARDGHRRVVDERFS